MNEVLEGLLVEKHPDKTFIGRVERGFDFLGYVFSVDGTVKVSRPAVERFTARATRLQERGADQSRIEAYARRWVTWVQAGVREVLRWEGDRGQLSGDGSSLDGPGTSGLGVLYGSESLE